MVIRRSILFGMGVAALMFSTELGARLYVNAVVPKSFTPEQITPEYNSLHEILTPDGYWITQDFHGQFYDITNGIRRTVNQPSQYTHTVWLFGNSGTFDPFVPDAYTMSSQLQAMLSEHGYAWRVVNLAVRGQLASSEYLRLKHTDVQADDMVVFIDGAMDDAVFSDCPNRFATVYLICSWYAAQHPEQPDLNSYRQVIAAARNYAWRCKTSFYHFVQPEINTHALDVLPGYPIHVAADGFVDSVHMNARGDTWVALILYENLTAF